MISTLNLSKCYVSRRTCTNGAISQWHLGRFGCHRMSDGAQCWHLCWSTEMKKLLTARIADSTLRMLVPSNADFANRRSRSTESRGNSCVTPLNNCCNGHRSNKSDTPSWGIGASESASENESRFRHSSRILFMGRNNWSFARDHAWQPYGIIPRLSCGESMQPVSRIAARSCRHISLPSMGA